MTYHCIFTSNKEIAEEFQIPLENVEELEMLYAFYEYENYSGDAFVLFKQNGKLYEVNGGHCSCYGLEGQWEPEETTKEALLIRNFNYPGVKEVIDAL